MATIGVPRPPPGPPPPHLLTPAARRVEDMRRRAFFRLPDTGKCPAPGVWQPKDSKTMTPPKLRKDTKHTTKSRARATFIEEERARFEEMYPPLPPHAPARVDTDEKPHHPQQAPLDSDITSDSPADVLSGDKHHTQQAPRLEMTPDSDITSGDPTGVHDGVKHYTQQATSPEQKHFPNRVHFLTSGQPHHCPELHSLAHHHHPEAVQQHCHHGVENVYHCPMLAQLPPCPVVVLQQPPPREDIDAMVIRRREEYAKHKAEGEKYEKMLNVKQSIAKEYEAFLAEHPDQVSKVTLRKSVDVKDAEEARLRGNQKKALEIYTAHLNDLTYNKSLVVTQLTKEERERKIAEERERVEIQKANEKVLVEKRRIAREYEAFLDDHPEQVARLTLKTSVKVAAAHIARLSGNQEKELNVYRVYLDDLKHNKTLVVAQLEKEEREAEEERRRVEIEKMNARYAMLLDVKRGIAKQYEAFLTEHPGQVAKVTLRSSLDVAVADNAQVTGDPKKAFDIYKAHLSDLDHNKALVVDQLMKEEREAEERRKKVELEKKYVMLLGVKQSIAREYEAFLANHPEQVAKVTLKESVDVTEAEKARLSGDPKRAFDIYTTHLNDLEHNKALVVDQLMKEEREAEEQRKKVELEKKYVMLLGVKQSIAREYEAFLANHPEQVAKVTLKESVDVTEAEKARLSGDPKRAFDIYTTHLNDLEHNKALVVDQLNKEERETEEERERIELAESTDEMEKYESAFNQNRLIAAKIEAFLSHHPDQVAKLTLKKSVDLEEMEKAQLSGNSRKAFEISTAHLKDLAHNKSLVINQLKNAERVKKLTEKYANALDHNQTIATKHETFLADHPDELGKIKPKKSVDVREAEKARLSGNPKEEFTIFRAYLNDLTYNKALVVAQLNMEKGEQSNAEGVEMNEEDEVFMKRQRSVHFNETKYMSDNEDECVDKKKSGDKELEEDGNDQAEDEFSDNDDDSEVFGEKLCGIRRSLTSANLCMLKMSDDDTCHSNAKNQESSHLTDDECETFSPSHEQVLKDKLGEEGNEQAEKELEWLSKDDDCCESSEQDDSGIPRCVTPSDLQIADHYAIYFPEENEGICIDDELKTSSQSQEHLVDEVEEIVNRVELSVLDNLAKFGRLICLETAFNGRANSEMMERIKSLETVIETKPEQEDPSIPYECCQKADLVEECAVTAPNADEDDSSDYKFVEQPGVVVHSELIHDETTVIGDGRGPSLTASTPCECSQRTETVKESTTTEALQTSSNGLPDVVTDDETTEYSISTSSDDSKHDKKERGESMPTSTSTSSADSSGEQIGPTLPAFMFTSISTVSDNSVEECAVTAPKADKDDSSDNKFVEQPGVVVHSELIHDETTVIGDGRGPSLTASTPCECSQRTETVKESTTTEASSNGLPDVVTDDETTEYTISSSSDDSKHDKKERGESMATSTSTSSADSSGEQIGPTLPAFMSTSISTVSDNTEDDKKEQSVPMFTSSSAESNGDRREQSGPILPAFISTSISTSSIEAKDDEGERSGPILRAFTSTSISTSSAESRATHNTVTSSSSPQRKRQCEGRSLKPKQIDNKPAKGDPTEYRKKVSFPQEEGGQPENHRSNLTFYAKMHPNELGELISSALVSDIMAYASASSKEVSGDSGNSSVIAVKYMSVMTTEKNGTTLQPVFAGKNGDKQSTLAFTISGEMLLSSPTSDTSGSANTVENVATQVEDRGKGPSVSFKTVIPAAQSESSETPNIENSGAKEADGTNVGTNTPTSEDAGLKSVDHSSIETESPGHVLSSTNDEIQANNENPGSCSLSCKTSSQTACECVGVPEPDKNVSERDSVMPQTKNKESASLDTGKHTALLENNGLQFHFDISAMCSAMCKAIPHVLNQMAIETAANGSVTLDREAFMSTEKTKSPVDTVIRKPTSPEDQNTHSDVGTTSKREAADQPPYTYRLITPSAFNTTPELLKEMTNCPGATKSDSLPTFTESVTMDHKYQEATKSDNDTTFQTSTGPQKTESQITTSTRKRTEIDSMHTSNSEEKTEYAVVPFDSQILTLKVFNTTGPYESGTVTGTEGGAKENTKRPLTLDAAAKLATGSESDVENRGNEIDTENPERALVPFDSQLITLKAFDTTAKQGTFNDLTVSQEHVEVDMSTVADKEQTTIVGGGERDRHVMNYTTDAGVCKYSKTMASLRRADLEEAVKPPNKCSQAEKFDFRQTKSMPPEMDKSVLLYRNVAASKAGIGCTTDASVCKDSKTLASFRRADLEEAVNEPVKHSKINEVDYHRAKSWPLVFPMEPRPALLPRRAKMNQNMFQTSETHTAHSALLKATSRAVKKQGSHCSNDCAKGTETTNGSQKHFQTSNTSISSGEDGYSLKSLLHSSGHDIAAPGLAQRLYKAKSLPIKLREAGHRLTRHMRSESDCASAVPRLPKLV